MKYNFKIVGYSGHSYVILDSAIKQNYNCEGYYDINKKILNPFNLKYFGSEKNINEKENLFISIGDNMVRKHIFKSLVKNDYVLFCNIIDPSSSLSRFAKINPDSSVYIGVNSVINSLAEIQKGVIINTCAIIEHEVKINEFAHIGPNAIICGNVTIGKNVFIGSNAVVKEGVKIGNNSIIGAGAVVLNNIPPNTTYVGNPAKKIN